MKISITMEQGGTPGGLCVSVTADLPDDPSSSARELAIKTLFIGVERLWDNAAGEAEHSVPCFRCNGTGKHSASNIPDAKCGACNGTGKMTAR